ncbi:hypothetical protein [Nitrosomonas ureae]|uniref:Uncharacterized protein n=1 Tax=Nitrosomonas ureae TaxID=44577 RepID=A0A2T5IM14_9PROT|nr:hypothetical protein [Nitrosomonas ureae]PTQ84865.1 hypothetical protein C8R28_101669 [Nitrosomonas ureae]
MDFSSNVFINCPFDGNYYALLRPLLFTVIYLGMNPRISLESLDSGKPRISKIEKLIEESKYGIHDLSRIKAEKAGEFFRLNMPFELGLDVGCRIYKGGQWSDKKCLILETERYRYQAAISDLSNSDIEAHKNEPEEVVAIVRNWLNGEAKLAAHGPTRIWNAFNDFMADNYNELINKGFSSKDVEKLPVNELIAAMKGWVSAHT